MIRPTVTALLISSVLAGSAGGQVIRGSIIQDGLERPIPFADVILLDTRNQVLRSSQADSLGQFVFEIPPGTYKFRAAAMGFMGATSPPISIDTQEELDIRIVLSADAILLAPLEITARSRPLISGLTLQGYNERRERNLGFAITREQIEERNPRRTTDLLHMAPGVHVVFRFGGSAVQIRGTGVRFRQDCETKVILDGLIFRWGATTLDDIPVDDIHAIEVFRNLAEIPAEYGGPDAACGVIAIWTRRGIR